MLSHVSIKYFKQAVQAQEYRETNLDIACKCPICGDSKTKRNSKRLHLYKKGDLELVNCFNAGCGCENKTVYSFLRDFYPGMLQQYKRETFQSTIVAIKESKNDGSLGDLVDMSLVNSTTLKVPSLLKTEESQESEGNQQPVQSDVLADFNFGEMAALETHAPFSTSTVPLRYDLVPYFRELDNNAIKYLTGRGITPHFGGKWFIGNQDLRIGETLYNIKDFLVIPLYIDNLMYGFYTRSFKDKKFITFISTLGYKVWNWYNINLNEPVYIFEAIFDGMSTGFDNIIANLGAKLPEERLTEIKEPIFCLDNDTTGIEMSIAYANRGYKVFIMPREYMEKDFNELKLNNPDLDIQELIKGNIFSSMSAVTRLKMKLWTMKLWF